MTERVRPDLKRHSQWTHPRVCILIHRCVCTRRYTQRGTRSVCHQPSIKGQEAKHRHHDVYRHHGVWSLYGNSGKNIQKDNDTFLAPSTAPPLLRFPDEQRRMEEEIVGRPFREERVMFMNLKPEGRQCFWACIRWKFPHLWNIPQNPT